MPSPEGLKTLGFPPPIQIWTCSLELDYGIDQDFKADHGNTHLSSGQGGWNPPHHFRHGTGVQKPIAFPGMAGDVSIGVVRLADIPSHKACQP